jgi:hypothetical protein
MCTTLLSSFQIESSAYAMRLLSRFKVLPLLRDVHRD